jgi:hypothetical protein
MPKLWVPILARSRVFKSLIDSVDKAFGAKFSGRLDILVKNVGSVW